MIITNFLNIYLKNGDYVFICIRRISCRELRSGLLRAQVVNRRLRSRSQCHLANRTSFPNILNLPCWLEVRNSIYDCTCWSLRSDLCAPTCSAKDSAASAAPNTITVFIKWTTWYANKLHWLDLQSTTYLIDLHNDVPIVFSAGAPDKRGHPETRRTCINSIYN